MGITLSDVVFERIVGSRALAATGRAVAPVLPVGCRKRTDRRIAPRVPFGERIQICRESGPMSGIWETVLMRDISCSGIGFMTHEPVPTETTLIARLTNGDGDHLRLRCCVRRCEKGGFGGVCHLVGASFEAVLPEAQIHLNDEDGHVVEWEPTVEASALTSAGAAVAQRESLLKSSLRLIRMPNLLKSISGMRRRADGFDSL